MESLCQKQFAAAADEEQAGRIGYFKDGGRVVVVGQGQDVLAGLLAPGHVTVDGLGERKIEKQVGLVADDAAHGSVTGREDRAG